MARAKPFEATMFDVLREVQVRRPDLIPADIDVEEEYGISRSLRKGSNTTATNNKVSRPDREAQNRWRSVEAAKARAPTFRMSDHYLEVAQIVETLLRYSRAL